MDSTEQMTRRSAPESAVWTLTLVHHPDASVLGRRLVLEQGGTVTLGRSLAVLAGEADRKLSRAHAAVVFEGHRPVVVDLQSRNGTFVDGVRVERAALREGSVVGVGNLLLLLHRRPPLFEPPDSPRLIGVSAAMSELLAEVARLAPRREAVTIVGEPGVGKGLVAEELHLASGRTGPFVLVHCGALSDDRLHAQLFGEGDAGGLLESAHGGTLFLDGIDDASVALQTALLSFLEDGRVRRVGAPQARSLDVRVLASARVDPRTLSLRTEFATRIGASRLTVPPLSARPEDIGAIAASFVGRLEGAPRLHHSLALALLERRWPANVRELLGVLEQVALVRDPESPGELRLDPRLAALLSEPPPQEPIRDGAVVAADGSWFEAPEVGRVSLESRRQLERILAALVAAHRSGRGSSVGDLVAAGWPGEKVLPRAGASRVYVSITSLRKLGLRTAIKRGAEGYRLSLGVRIA
jgi:transcriptional regulator with AAA-type ATPase domain